MKFVLYHVPYNQHEVIKLIGEENVGKELMQYFNHGILNKQAIAGIVFVYHFHWKKRISKNLILEIFDFLEPIKIDESQIRNPNSSLQRTLT